MRVLAWIALLVCAAGVCQAKTEFRLASGDCEGSTVGWWSTSRYDNGRLVETWGMDCNGREYHTFGRTVTISGPLAGAVTDLGTCNATPAGSSWYAVVTRDQHGAPTAVWGRDCAGEYWQAVIVPASASQLTPGTLQPVTGERGIR